MRLSSVLVATTTVLHNCPQLKTLQIPAFLGDLKEKRAIVQFRNNLDPHTQWLWTAEAQVEFLQVKARWVIDLCPNFSNHSLSTLHEFLCETNSTHFSLRLNYLVSTLV